MVSDRLLRALGGWKGPFLCTCQVRGCRDGSQRSLILEEALGPDSPLLNTGGKRYMAPSLPLPNPEQFPMALSRALALSFLGPCSSPPPPAPFAGPTEGPWGREGGAPGLTPR